MGHTRWPGKLLIALVLVFIYLPIVAVVVYSFNQSKSAAEFTGFSLRWYETLFGRSQYRTALGNSLIVGACSVLLAGIIGTLGAIGMASREFKVKGTLESVAILPIMIPEIILGVAFMFVFGVMGLGGGLLRLILAHVTFSIPYVYLIVKARLADTDRSLLEAARDLGAGPMRAFLTVLLPLIGPGVAAGMLLSFAMSFDDVVISMFLSSPGKDLLPVKIYSSLKVGMTPEINALFTLILLALGLLLGLSAFGATQKNKLKKDD